MKFHKYHALGNDYIVIAPSEFKQELKPSTIRRICHRHFGIGGDGILWGPIKPESQEFARLKEQAATNDDEDKAPALCGLRIFNPDGSEAEKSGNGLRIFSRFLFDKKLVEEDREFQLLTLGGRVASTVLDSGTEVRVQMGRVSFNASDIPVRGFTGEVLGKKIQAAAQQITFSAATIGNPHCVVLTESISPELAKQIGPALETHPAFPNRTNVQFMKALDRHRIAVEIWERGAGYTLASGSSASACAAIAVRLGVADSPVTIEMPGGNLNIEVSQAFDITMRGPVTKVADGEIHPEMF